VLPFGVEQKKIPGELSRSSWEAAEEADMVMVVVDAGDAARKIDRKVRFIFDEMRDRDLKGFLVLNKVDLVHPKEQLLGLAQDLFSQANFSECFMISALQGKGLDALEKGLRTTATERPWKFPELQVHTASKQELAIEVC